MADVTMRADLVGTDVLGSVDRVAQSGRVRIRDARRTMGVAVGNVLAWTTARLTKATTAKTKTGRMRKRLAFAIAFLVIGYLFLQTGILNALLSIPFAIFG